MNIIDSLFLMLYRSVVWADQWITAKYILRNLVFLLCAYYSSAACRQAYGGQHCCFIHSPAAGLPLSGQPGKNRCRCIQFLSRSLKRKICVVAHFLFFAILRLMWLLWEKIYLKEISPSWQKCWRSSWVSWTSLWVWRSRSPLCYQCYVMMHVEIDKV